MGPNVVYTIGAVMEFATNGAVLNMDLFKSRSNQKPGYCVMYP
jgi:hypothetical protein